MEEKNYQVYPIVSFFFFDNNKNSWQPLCWVAHGSLLAARPAYLRFIRRAGAGTEGPAVAARSQTGAEYAFQLFELAQKVLALVLVGGLLCAGADFCARAWVDGVKRVPCVN